LTKYYADKHKISVASEIPWLYRYSWTWLVRPMFISTYAERLRPRPTCFRKCHASVNIFSLASYGSAKNTQIAARKLGLRLHTKAQRKNDRSTSVLTWKRKIIL